MHASRGIRENGSGDLLALADVHFAQQTRDRRERCNVGGAQIARIEMPFEQPAVLGVEGAEHIRGRPFPEAIVIGHVSTSRSSSAARRLRMP